MEKVRISLVSYLNTKPFLYGLQHSEIKNKIDISLEYPAIGFEKMLNGKAEIGLVPVAFLHELPGTRIFSDYCIGSDGKVKTVCLFSNCSLTEVEKIWLDYQSRTSVLLTKILLEKYWKLSPELAPATKGFEQNLGKGEAGLIIGDRAIVALKRYKYVYDLGEYWKKFTDLPMVFAVWVCLTDKYVDLLSALNNAFEYGVTHIKAVAQQFAKDPIYRDFDIKQYLTANIRFLFDNKARMGLQQFLKLSKPVCYY